MTYIGLDHHKKWTQAAAIDDQAKIIREMRVLNDGNSLKGPEGSKIRIDPAHVPLPMGTIPLQCDTRRSVGLIRPGAVSEAEMLKTTSLPP
jgi:hypothetical protein